MINTLLNNFLSQTSRLAAIFALSVFFVSTGWAKTITVDIAGGADYTAIQPAITSALSGDTIQVAPGTYNENVILKNGIILKGSGADLTTIDGGGRGKDVVKGALSSQIIGFKIQNSGAFDMKTKVPYGIDTSYGRSTIIKNCLIIDNYHGVCVGYSDSKVINCTIIDNNGPNPGMNAYPIDLWVFGTGSPEIKNNIIGDYYGLCNLGNMPTPSITYNDILATYKGGGYEYIKGTGGISANPAFVDRTNGNYHLNSGSPCIDTGDPLISDKDGSRSDIGVSQWTYVKKDLVLYLKFDEGSGNTAYDSSDYGNDGIINGASWTNAGVNKCLSFDGIDDLVKVADSDSLDITNAMTLEAWIKPMSLPKILAGDYKNIISKRTLPGGYHLELIKWGSEGSEAQLCCFIDEGSGFDYMGVFSDLFSNQEWIHVATTMENNILTTYINGLKIKSKTISVESGINGSDLHIGAATEGSLNVFDGLIDEVKIYNYARTEAQIASDVNAVVVKEAGFQGFAYERNADGSIGSKLSGVNITFTSEDGSTVKNITTDSASFYRIKLNPARYVVTANYSNYKDYSTFPGFFVCTGDGYQAGNFFLKKVSRLLPAPSGVYCGWSWTSSDHLDRQVSWNVINSEDIKSYRVYVKHPGSSEYKMEIEIPASISERKWILIEGDGAYQIITFPSDRSKLTYVLRRKGVDHPVGTFTYMVHAVDINGIEGDASSTVNLTHAGPLDIKSASGNPTLVSWSSPLDSRKGSTYISALKQPNAYTAGSKAFHNSTGTSALFENSSLMVGTTYYIQVFKMVRDATDGQTVSMNRKKFVFMLPEKNPEPTPEPEPTPKPEPIPEPPVVKDSAPPTVAISIFPGEVLPGDEVMVTLSGTDDMDLAAIWWWGAGTPDTELNKAHWYSCSGVTAEKVWIISTDNLPAGTYRLGANARDKTYPVPGKPHQASEGAGIVYESFTIIERESLVKAAIKNLYTGRKVSGNRITITAEIIKGKLSDCKYLTFQYNSGNGWQNIETANINHSNPDYSHPYFVHMDISDESRFPDGDYELRAVTCDINGISDRSPMPITIEIYRPDPDIVEKKEGKSIIKIEKIDNNKENTVKVGDDETNAITEVKLPKGALENMTDKLEIILNPPSIPNIPKKLNNISEIRKFSLKSGQTQFKDEAKVSIIIPYKDKDNDGIVDGTKIPEDTLKLYHYNEETLDWEYVEGAKVDTVNNILRAKLSHFSIYGIFGAPSNTYNDLVIYPNPFKPSKGHTRVIFRNLTIDTEIKILTIAGDIVCEKKDINAGEAYWDGKNEHGNDVASGVYIALITNKSGNKVIRKICVIR